MEAVIMGLVDIISNILFVIMGLFGISVQLKELNYFLLIGSLGMIVIVISTVYQAKKK